MLADSKSIAMRPLRVLEIIAERSEPVAVMDIARHVGVDRSTAYRILVNLTETGYVERDRSGTRYLLAHKVLWLAKSLLQKDDSKARIDQALADLAARTGETVHFSVLDGDSVLLTQSAKGKQRLSVDVAIGDRSPLHATSAGKILLAYAPERVVDDLIASGLKSYASNTITVEASLRVELRLVRAQGFAYDLHEFAEDMHCVAVPVFNRRGGLQGTISFSGPDSRFTLPYLDALRDAAKTTAIGLSEIFTAP